MLYKSNLRVEAAAAAAVLRVLAGRGAAEVILTRSGSSSSAPSGSVR